jgi:hypothetical protein
MQAIATFLQGKKTILVAIAYGIDAVGAQLGWWAADSIRTTIEAVLGAIFLRMAVK